MSKADYLRDAYRHILSSLEVYEESDGQGELSLYPPEEETTPIPLTIQEGNKTKRVVMPTQNYLRQGDWDNFLAFHPLCEHVMRGESETIKVTKRLVNFRLRIVLSDLLVQLLWISSNDDKHKELSPTQSKFIQPFSDADSKSVNALNKLLDKHSQELINIYLKPFGETNGEQYRRLACTSFRLYEELQSEGSKCMDINMGSKKAKRQILKAMETIVPGIEDQRNYYVGSNAQIAPNFDALMHCYAGFAKQLNKIVNKFKKHLANPEQLKTQLDWLEYFDELANYKDALPSLPGNQGATVRGEEQSEDKPSAQRMDVATAPKIDRSAHAQKAANTAVQQPHEPVGESVPASSQPMAPQRPTEQQQPAPSGGVPPAPQPAPIAAHSASQPQSSGNGGQMSWSEYKQRMGMGQQQTPAYNPYAPPQAPGVGGSMPMNQPAMGQQSMGQQSWNFQNRGWGAGQPQNNAPMPSRNQHYNTSL